MNTHRSEAGFPVWFERSVSSELIDLVPDGIARLGPGNPRDPFAGIEESRAVIASSLYYTAEVFDRVPGLEVLARTGIGVDRVDVAAATKRGIAVCNTPDGPTVSTAEHAIALILAAAKHLNHGVNQLVAGEANAYSTHPAVELAGETLGLVGFGRIARRVAHAALGLEMQVVAFDPFVDEHQFFVERAGSLEEVLARALVVSVHVPLTDANGRLFDAATLSRMRSGAIFVNTARGGLVDQDALLAAIDSGHLSAVALDVTEPEPLPPDHPLLHRQNVLVTPHVASSTKNSRRRIFATAIEEILAVLAGRRPQHLVNPDVWNSAKSGGGL